MGQHHILSISEDAIAGNPEHGESLAAAIGNAVVSLCSATPVVNMSGPAPVIVESRDILNYGGAIRRADDVHYTETAVFAWSQARLAPLRSLSTEELQDVSKLVSAEIESRSRG